MHRQKYETQSLYSCAAVIHYIMTREIIEGMATVNICVGQCSYHIVLANSVVKLSDSVT